MSAPFLLEKLFSDDVGAVYRGRALLVLAWRSTPTVAGIGPLSTVVLAAARSNPGAVVMCALIDTEMPMPDAATREALQVRIQRLGVMRGVVNVISGTGFRAAAMRGMLSGFALVVRPKYPLAFVGTVNEGASFVVTNWPEGDSPVPAHRDLARALTDVMPSFGARKTA